MPQAVQGVPAGLDAVYARPAQPFPHQHRPAGHSAISTVSDVRQPGIARTVPTNERGQTSPQRAQGKRAKKEGSNRHQASSPHPDNRMRTGLRSMDAANAGQVLTNSAH